MIHPDWLSGAGRKEGGTQCNIPDIAASHIQTRQLIYIQILGRGARGENAPPDFGALRDLWEWKLHDESKPAQKSCIQCLGQVRS
jgi:hypothetical protein